jgi:hypothetical protein
MLHDDATGEGLIRHEPNAASGGMATDVDLPEFLSRNSATPEGPGPLKARHWSHDRKRP